jgi:hypothetical protein
MQKALRITGAEARTPAACDKNDCAMAVLAPRFGCWAPTSVALQPRKCVAPSVSGVRCAFGQSYGSIASKWAQKTADAGRVSEAAVKQRKTLDTAACEGNQTRDRIEAGDLENFSCWDQAGPSDLAGKPITGDLIHFGACPVSPLFFISANGFCNATLKVRVCGFLLRQ